MYDPFINDDENLLASESDLNQIKPKSENFSMVSLDQKDLLSNQPESKLQPEADTIIFMEVTRKVS